MKGPWQTYFKASTSQKVAYTGTAGTITNPVGAQTLAVRIVTSSAAYVAFGTAPTATTSDMFMPANVPQVFRVGLSEKVSAVQDSVGGTLYVTELTN